MRSLGNRSAMRLLSLSLPLVFLAQAGCLSKTPSFELDPAPRDYAQAAENHPDHPFRTDIEEQTERSEKQVEHHAHH